MKGTWCLAFACTSVFIFVSKILSPEIFEKSATFYVQNTIVKSTVKNTLEFCALISNTNIHIAYLILHPIMVSGDLEIQPNLIETIWKWELKFKVLKWFQHDCFQQLERKGEFSTDTNLFRSKIFNLIFLIIIYCRLEQTG